MKVPFVKLQQRGALMVMFAILLPVMILFVGLALDFGILYLERNKLQDVADATALAGAAHMQDENNGLAEEIARYVKLNDGDFKNVQINDLVTSLNLSQWGNKAAIGTNATVLVEYGVTGPLTSAKFEDNDRVRVRLTKRVPIFFLGSLLGDDDANGVAVSVMAAAKGSFRENPQTVKGGLALIVNNFELQCFEAALKVPDKYEWSFYSNNVNAGIIDDFHKGNMTVFSPNNINDKDQIHANHLNYFDKRFSTDAVEYNQFYNEIRQKTNYFTKGDVYPIYVENKQSGDNICYAELWEHKNNKLVLTGYFYNDQLQNRTEDIYVAAKDELSQLKAEKARIESTVKATVHEAKASIEEYKQGLGNKRYISVRHPDTNIDIIDDSVFVANSNIKEKDDNIDLYIECIGNFNDYLVVDNSWLRDVKNINNIFIKNTNFDFILATDGVSYKGVYAIDETTINLAGKNNIFSGYVANESQNRDIKIIGDNLHFRDDFVIVGGKDTIIGKGDVKGLWRGRAVAVNSQERYSINAWYRVANVDSKMDLGWKIHFGEGQRTDSQTTLEPSPIIPASKITLVE